MLVATGLLGTVIFAALVLAVQEHHLRPAEVAEKAMQASREVLPNANPVELLKSRFERKEHRQNIFRAGDEL
jgi:hypothetical protein